MAKKESNTKDKPREKPKKRAWWIYLLRFMMLRAVRWLLSLTFIVILIFWQWSALTSWTAGVRDSALALFGWGLILIALTVVTIVGMTWRRQLLTFLRRWKLHQWNKWLGSIAFILAVWGILALLGLGGNFGLGIIGSPNFNGIFRILGLVIAGTILIAPKACFRLTASSILWLGKEFKRQPAPGPTIKPTPQQKTVLPPVTETPTPPEIKPEREQVISASTPIQAQQELRQIAQEVWKKYGESSTSVTIDGWRLPPIDILDESVEGDFGQATNAQRAKLIEEALASYGVEAKVVQVNAGPTVTQFGVEPGWERKTREIKERDRDGNFKARVEEISKTRVKVDKITSLANDLALALAAPSIRMEAPVPGKSVIGIEVPNTISDMVSLRGVIETSAFQKMETKSKLSLALGKGAGGEAITADLSRMPHLLIAGATGSGKTACLNAIICCLLLHNTPNEARFIMIDPKRVELTPFNSIPHLATPVIVDTSKALGTLRWLNVEMDKRYQELAKAVARNIEAYNKNKSGKEKLPYLVLIIDELADLMMAGYDEVEHILCRLAQLARATGIHLVVATQRPSVDVVTGLIKANFPTRISFAVTSQTDSRTILDMGGAEKLMGRGDMLYMPTEAAKPKRLQGCFVSDAESERLVYFWGNQREKEAAPLKIEDLAPPTTGRKEGIPPGDSLLDAAKQLAREHKQISTSYLQRKLRIGYPRAARIMEQLEEEEKKKKEEEEEGEEEEGRELSG